MKHTAAREGLALGFLIATRSLIGAAIALMVVARGHPLLATERRAATADEHA